MNRAALILAAAIVSVAARARAEAEPAWGGEMPSVAHALQSASSDSIWPLPPAVDERGALRLVSLTEPTSANQSLFAEALASQEAAPQPASEQAKTDQPETPDAPAPSEQKKDDCGCGWEHIGCLHCGPSVCRYDWPADCGGCVTDHYCPHPCTDCPPGHCRICEKCGEWTCDGRWCDVNESPYFAESPVVRFGWWGVDADGSRTKIGEYQDLRSSPFWDFDSVRSDGVRTWDIILSGLDNEANDARVRYYGPGMSARLNYQRFLRRWDHDPLAGAPITGALGPADNVVTQDLNVGEDYAIRVQQLDVRFQGHLTDNIKWRLNVWGQQKSGERQANATAHCFDVDPSAATNNVCHVLSQRQTIDWLTQEIQPVIEARFDNITLEYSRTMREFGQGDSAVVRQYTRFAPFAGAGNTLGAPFAYAITPENFTQVDRLKLRAQLTDTSQFYANAYYGDTENYFRDTHRQYGGFDARLTNRSIDNLSLTAYATMHDEANDFPPFLLPEETNAGVMSQMRHPIDYTSTRAGLRGRWLPYADARPGSADWDAWQSLSIASGYEYYFLERDFATFQTALGPFTQPDTTVHQIEIGPQWRPSPVLDNYIRYKVRFIDDPVIGVREANGRFNTNQPEQEHRVEIGGTWTPSDYFMATAEVGIVNRWHDSEFAYFQEDDYPFLLTLWYAPAERWSLSGGYGYFNNAIDQNITLGYRFNVADQTETTYWEYGGEAHLVSLNAAYAWSDTVQLVAGYEWNRGDNQFRVPPSPAGANWSSLPYFSDVIVETQRLTAGVDWALFSGMNVYCRYVFFDWNDLAAQLDSGTAHMVLAGATLYR
jgi:hypothetical protein